MYQHETNSLLFKMKSTSLKLSVYHYTVFHGKIKISEVVHLSEMNILLFREINIFKVACSHELNIIPFFKVK